MEEIFGLPADTLMPVLVVMVVVILFVLALISLRNRVVVKLGARNIPRRRAQTALIIAGLTLSTIIIGSALGTGDTMTYSMRRQAVDALGQIDETITAQGQGGDRPFGFGGLQRPATLSQQRYDELRASLAGDPLIEGFTPAIESFAALTNQASGQSESQSSIFAAGPEFDAQFGGLATTGGARAALGELAAGEVYLNRAGADALATAAGDTLEVFTGAQPTTLKVRAIVENEGIATNGPTIILPLAEAQRLLGMEGDLTAVLITNKGGVLDGVEHSEAVTQRLRGLLVNRTVADELIAQLRSPAIRPAIDAGAPEIPEGQERLVEQVAALRAELDAGGSSDRLLSLLAERRIANWVSSLKLPDETRAQLGDRFAGLSTLQVNTVKANAIDFAEAAGSIFSTIFLVIGSFSMISGVLLIFMLFVMLAAERKSELGMARAVGMQRRHLIQMFVTEGAIYDLIAAMLGVLLGVGVLYVMVTVLSSVFSSFSGGAFRVLFHVEPRSLIISYCLGVLLTFVIVTFSSWRVSRLNIVSAIRDLPEDLQAKKVGCFTRVWRFSMGPLLFLLGLPIMLVGYNPEVKQQAPVLLGISLMIIGGGLFVRWILQQTALRATRRDRLVFTLIGVGLLLLWGLPDSVRNPALGIEDFEADIEIFILSGSMMVAGAIWTLMYNADLLLGLMNLVFGRFGNLAPVLKTATAYPLSARFRTGMALAMFSLVIFTIITMSTIVGSLSALFGDIDVQLGGFQVQATAAGREPEDLRQPILQTPGLPAGEIAAVAGLATLPAEVRQVGATRQTWARYSLLGYDQAYIDQARQLQSFIRRAPGFADDAAVWQALLEREDVTVVSQALIPSRMERGGDAFRPLALEGVYVEDTGELPPLELQVRDAVTGEPRTLRVIGVFEASLAADGIGGLQVGPRALERMAGGPVIPQLYFISVRQGADDVAVAQAIEKAFLPKGVNAASLVELAESQTGSTESLFNLLKGFMALGLLVGIAALGVISSRAVVERRQQIGMLRAIGYRQSMVGLSFLLESSFIALLGIGIGTLLGLNTAWNLVQQIAEGQPDVVFRPPWVEIGLIVGLAYLFSLITTILPARKAARIYPAEALRYE